MKLTKKQLRELPEVEHSYTNDVNVCYDWRVTVFGPRNGVIKQFLIESRTEREAEKEAFSDVNGYDDWTMVPVKRID